MTALLSVVLTFLGTLIVAGAGLWQWQRSRAGDRKRAYHEKRVEALRTVWETLRDVEEQQRAGMRPNASSSTDPLHESHVRNVNLLLMRFAPFLQPDEAAWATTIVQHVVEIDTLMRSLGQQGRPGAGWWLISAAQPPELSVAAAAASGLRDASDALAVRYAAVMRGDHD